MSLLQLNLDPKASFASFSRSTAEVQEKGLLSSRQALPAWLENIPVFPPYDISFVF